MRVPMFVILRENIDYTSVVGVVTTSDMAEEIVTRYTLLADAVRKEADNFEKLTGQMISVEIPRFSFQETSEL